MCSSQQGASYMLQRAMCHSLPEVLLPFQTRLWTSSACKKHLLKATFSASLLLFHPSNQLQLCVWNWSLNYRPKRWEYLCLYISSAPHIAASHKPSGAVQWDSVPLLPRKCQCGAAPTFTIRLRCSSDWLKFLPISKMLIVPSSQRLIQVWYSSRSGSLSQNVLKTSQTVSWHTEGTRKVWC